MDAWLMGAVVVLVFQHLRWEDSDIDQGCWAWDACKSTQTIQNTA